MKKLFFIITIAIISQLSAQVSRDITLGLQIGVGPNYAQVKDNATQSSGENIAADGATSAEVNRLKGQNIKLMVNYDFNEYYALSTGLYFGERRLNILNIDGSYQGTSVYHVDYAHLPILLQYSSNELRDYLNLIVKVGLTFDFLRNEAAQEADYAHFMSLAHNNYSQDGRSRNGNNTPVDLFDNVGISLFLSAGLQYRFTDKFSAYAGFAFHQRLTNMLNPDLVYNDSQKTAITEDLSFKTGMLSFELGVGFDLAAD